MVPPCHHVSVLINLNMTRHRIGIQVYPMNLLGWHRLGLKSILTHKKHDLEPRSASDQYSGQSDEPRIASSRPKKHADGSKHKVRSRYVSSSSEEDQSSAPRHRTSKPSRSHSDQDQPQHDPERVNTLNLLLPLPSDTRWDSLVMRTRFRS